MSKDRVKHPKRAMIDQLKRDRRNAIIMANLRRFDSYYLDSQIIEIDALLHELGVHSPTLVDHDTH